MFGYFGPAGTFTHQALLSFSSDAALPFATVPGALDAVREGDVEAVLVPIENSVEGGVTATLDNLATGDPLVIVREVLLPVQFVVAVRPGTQMDAVRRVLTHPHAYAQTRDWVRRNLPAASVTEGGSTAGAAEEVLLDEGDAPAELGGAQRAGVAAAATSEDDDVMGGFGGGRHELLLRAWVGRLRASCHS